MGGIVISGVAERLPKNISELVYVAACLLRDGESIRSISASVTDSIVRENMLPAADWSTVAIREEGLKETFFADCSEEDCSRASTLIGPEPTAAFGTPIRVTASRFGDGRKVAKAVFGDSRDRHDCRSSRPGRDAAGITSGKIVAGPDQFARRGIQGRLRIPVGNNPNCQLDRHQSDFSSLPALTRKPVPGSRGGRCGGVQGVAQDSQARDEYCINA
ncbi:MAG: hypothetical protein WB586_29505 [Chthoniobacterales bacterium]